MPVTIIFYLLAFQSPGNEVTPIASVLRLRSSGHPEDSPVPARVRGTVTYRRDGPVPDLIIQDDSAGLFLSVTSEQLKPLRVGDRIEADGTLIRGNFSPRLQVRGMRVIGAAALPDPNPVCAPELSTGRLDCLRVELRGVIRSAVVDTALDPPRLIARLVGPAGATDLWVLQFDPAVAATLPDAEVVVRGVCLAWDTPRRQLRGVRLLVNDLADLQVTSPSPPDPFARPATPPADLLRFTPDGISPHRLKVRGVVTARAAGEGMVIQRHGIGVRVRTSVGTPAVVGDEVEAVGFPAVVGFSTELQDAEVKVVGPGPEVNPLAYAFAVEAERPNDADADLRLVRVRGVLRLGQPTDGGVRLHLDDRGAFFVATLPGSPPELAVGSELELVGVCELVPSARVLRRGGRADAFTLHLRSTADITVVRSGPWFTNGRLVGLLVAALGVATFALVWVVVLRRVVDLRTARLVREIAARHDAEVESRAVAGERARVAGELHDTLEQVLTGAALQVEAAELASGSSSPAAEHLRYARGLLAASRRELRETLHDLRSVDGACLPDELAELARAMTPAGGPTIRVSVSGEPLTLPEEVVHHTFRAARELVTNAVKHAAATTVSLDLVIGDAVTLTVRDDGRGFTPRAAGGFGLPGLSQRAAKTGGSFSITAAPGGGTVAVLRIPLVRGTA